MLTNDIDIIHMVLNASFMVQLVLLLLLTFSVISWTIIILKFRYIRRAFKESAVFLDYFWKSRDFSEALSKAKTLEGSPVARLFRSGYTELKKTVQSGASQGSGQDISPLGARIMGIDNVKRALRRGITTETTRMTQMVPFLATTGNTTPFIGLFGTVWGIMGSFHGIGLRGSASLAVVAPGISEALVATAAGLAVAIPAVIAFNYFIHQIRTLESELDSFSADFLNIVERDLMRTKERSQ
ncbi:MAG: protein TolQ [Desulfobacterales bacterium CG23_combo_of_CG06-09_8_20_14_all_52_9]|nr:MAG: protein TolQ [Desulfobacterales bacterium CG23_combo_of_CG06-09_8_20_14_all_52_9]